MRTRRTIPGLLLALALLLPGAALAQIVHPGVSRPATEDGVLGNRGLGDLLGELGETAFAEHRDDLIRSLNSVFESKPGALGFLNDLNLRLKAFNGDHGEDNNTSVGFSYAYHKSLERELASERPTYRGLDVAFDAKGNVAVTNPEDFLDTRLEFSYFQSMGGAAPLPPSEQATYRVLRSAWSCLDAQSDEDRAHCASQSSTFSGIGLDDGYDEDDVLGRTYQLIDGYLTNQFAFEFTGSLAFESTQDFDDSQLVYGTHLAMVYKGWADLDAQTWDDVSRAGRLNVLDYPFALIRFMAGTTEGFAPSAMALPSLLVGVGLVDPQANDARARAGDDGDFVRLNGELAFKTLLFDLQGEGLLGRLGDVYFTTSVRYYQELDARSSVKRAGLDDHHYVVVTLSGSNGLFVSWAQGALPFDQRNDQIVELGWKVHF